MAEWWQSGIIYQIYPRSFADSNGDGVGDLRGIIGRLDYLRWLGIDAIWVSPIYPSPMRDFGYDITDYTDIHPMFGSIEDFDALVAAAHAQGIKIILDYVPNHSSNEHPWFVESRSSRDNPKRDYYIWRDAAPQGGPPNNWLAHFGGSVWEWDDWTGQYYLHSFLPEQPDLNWRNPTVRREMYDVLRFWLAHGVDGFRVDVLYQVIKDDEFRDDPENPDYTPTMGPHNKHIHVFSMDRPEVHDVAREIRGVLEEFGDGVMIGEIWLPIERLMTYYGAECNGTHLPLNFQLIELSWNAAAIHSAIEQYEDLLPIGGWPNWVLGNHDVHRIASRVGRAQARIAAIMLLTLRGTPTMYYGDEIGMTDVPIPADRVCDPLERNVPGLGLGRDPQRTPMQWAPGAGAGFTPGPRTWLPVADDAAEHNVETERDEPASVLTLYRRLIDLRRREPALAIGDYEEYAVTNTAIAWIRTHGDARFLVAINLSHEPAGIALGDLRGTVVVSTDLEGIGTRCGDTLVLGRDRGLVVRIDG